MLVSASWTIRNAVKSMLGDSAAGGPAGLEFDGQPRRAHLCEHVAEVGEGRRGRRRGASVGPRRTPRSRRARSSPRGRCCRSGPPRGRACGRAARQRRPAASAWTATRLTWCATTSWSSRAMRVRSRRRPRAPRPASASAASAPLLRRRRRPGGPGSASRRQGRGEDQAREDRVVRLVWPGGACETAMREISRPATPPQARPAPVEDGRDADRRAEGNGANPNADRS